MFGCEHVIWLFASSLIEVDIDILDLDIGILDLDIDILDLHVI